jgi:hypothetical protein
VFGMGTGVALAPLPPAKAGPSSGEGEKVRGGSRAAEHSSAGLLVCSHESQGDDQAARAISTARLSMLPCVHLPPINVLVSNGPSEGLRPGSAGLGGGFPLRCFQRFSRPDVATRRCHGRDSRYTRGRSIPVLSY